MNFVASYGQMLDMIQSFVLQLNPEYNDQSQNRYGFEWVQNHCEELPRELMVFFKAPVDKDRSVVENLFSREGDALIGASLETYIEKVFAKECILDYLTEYYFSCKYEEITLVKLRDLLDHCNIGDDFRYLLLNFYIDADRYIDLLHEQMRKRYPLIEQCHTDNQALIASINSELIPEMFGEIDKEIWNIDTTYNEIGYSICIVANAKIERRGLGNADGENVFFTLGIHWKEKMLVLAKKNKIDINLFGKILSEPNRRKLIEYLIENEEITVAQAVEFLNASVTATAYHLNMMHSARMLKPRYEGRKIYYSLQKDYFEIAIAMLRDLADRI